MSQKHGLASLMYLAFAVTVQGCAGTSYLVTGLEDKKQQLIYQQIGKAVVSQKNATVSVASALPLQKSSEVMRLLVTAKGTSGILDPDRIAVTYDGRLLRKYTSSEIAEEIRSRMQSNELMAVLFSSLAAYSAGQSAGRYRDRGYVSGINSSGEFVSGTYRYTVSGFDSRAAEAASASSMESSSRSFSQQQARYRSELDAVTPQVTLTRLKDDKWIGGTIYLEAISPRDGGILSVSIDLGNNETHELRFVTDVTK
ncbi:MAG: hypothetical protein Q8M20_11710 [Rhodocyclaceae bacterium]|nr:hypothetical protein [Rhodocyclaceae bacterium]MDZ4215326.1 hypothetical protein [Rhodocyclaceae bacterium]